MKGRSIERPQGFRAVCGMQCLIPNGQLAFFLLRGGLGCRLGLFE
jgi:hypothetical protein